MSSIVFEKPLEKTVQILGVNVSVISIELYTSARLAVSISCKSGDVLFNDYKEIVISGDDYANWSNDDSYITNLVVSKIPELTGSSVTN